VSAAADSVPGVDPDLERAAYWAALTDAEVVAFTAPETTTLEYAHRARAEAAHAEMMRRLVVALREFKTSSDRTAQRLVWLTVVLVVMTAVIAWFTVELARHPGAG
jgi:hypothetical protein